MNGAQPPERFDVARVLPGAGIVVGCAIVVGLHVLVPSLGGTWAYAHLGRHVLSPPIAAALILGMPPLVGWLWTRPAAQTPVRRASVGAAAASVVLVAIVVALGLRWPVRPICIDSVWFAKGVEDGVTQSPRWQLTLWSFSAVAGWVRPWLAVVTTVRVLNGVLAGVALIALGGAAREVGRTAGEATAITLITWSAFGTAQLAAGYLDVYPVALAFVALHLWAGAAALAGKRHPAWAVALAAAGPFFYVGLVLLAPSACALAWFGGPAESRRRRLAVCAAVALVVAGISTVPVEGAPFAWPTFVRAMATEGNPAAAFGRGGPLLTPAEIATPSHLLGLVQLVLLLDPVGVLMLAACGAVAAAACPRPTVWWGVAVIAPQLLYLVTMDPLFGHFADWDLFSYLAASTSFFGAACFIVWSRGSRSWGGVVLGVALAAALVHLLARLNALDVAYAAHLAETPFRIVIPGR